MIGDPGMMEQLPAARAIVTVGAAACHSTYFPLTCPSKLRRSSHERVAEGMRTARSTSPTARMHRGERG